MKTSLSELLPVIHHSIIISCQALPGEPLYCEEMSIMPFMARAAKAAGAGCIRTSSVRDVVAIKEMTGLPVIGLIKRRYEGYEAYITPTMREIDELAEAEADVVALDCTMRTRGDGLTINEFLKRIRDKYPDMALMADISTVEEGLNAQACGVDLVGTTLSGYTPYSPVVDGPDFELVRELSAKLSLPLIAEGKIHTPQEARQMLAAGAYAVVVGGAVTRPFEIASRFYQALKVEN